MKIELNQLIEHFSELSFRVQGVYRFQVEPGASGRQKSFPYPGFVFPLQGKALYRFNGTPYVAEQGSVLHGSANANLEKRVLGKKRWEFISVFYEIRGEEPGGLRLPQTHFKWQLRDNAQRMRYLHELWEKSIQPGGLPAFQTDTLFRRLLEEVFMDVRNQSNNSVWELFKSVTDYIHEHYAEDFSVAELARMYGVNENRLFYIFKKHCGMGAGDYLIAHRLNRAKERLIIGDERIADIAQSVGYADALYFSRSFRNRFGIAPSALRDHFRNCPCRAQDCPIPASSGVCYTELRKEVSNI